MKLIRRKNKVSSHHSPSERKYILGDNTSFVVDEAYNTLRSNIIFSMPGKGCKVVEFTSCGMSDGKSINVLNTAITGLSRSITPTTRLRMFKSRLKKKYQPVSKKRRCQAKTIPITESTMNQIATKIAIVYAPTLLSHRKKIPIKMSKIPDKRVVQDGPKIP